MTDQKLSDLTEATSILSTDLLYAVASGQSRRISAANAGKGIIPITTRGDVTRGGVGGVPERLALGSINKIAGSDGSDFVYFGGMLLKTGDFSILTSEHMFAYRVNGAFTGTLPTLAASGDFFTSTLVNVGSGIVTLAGNGAETIRGFGVIGNTVTLPSAGDYVTVTNGSEWEIIGLRATFESAEQTITSGANHSVAHGLPTAPYNAQTFIRCKTAELGFSIGDEVPITQAFNDGASDYNVTTAVDATNIVMTVGVDGIRVARQSATIGELTAITNASWRLVARARL